MKLTLSNERTEAWNLIQKQLADYRGVKAPKK